MKQFSTSDLMKTFNLGRNALRLYEEMGLLTAMKRTDAGYRIYGPEQLEDLKFVIEAKEVGFTLSEIGDLLGTLRRDKKTTCGTISSEVEEKIRLIDEELLTLKKKKAFLADFQKTCASNVHDKTCDVKTLGFKKQACCD